MKSKILFALCALFGLLMIVFGSNKFLNFIPMPKDMSEKMIAAMTAIASLKWLMPLAGIAEIVGGALMIMPKTRALGAIVILPITVGIFLFNAVVEPAGLAMAGALLAINLWAIADNWKKYLPMISSSSRY